MYPIASNNTEAVSVCKKYFNLPKKLQSNQHSLEKIIKLINSIKKK